MTLSQSKARQDTLKSELPSMYDLPSEFPEEPGLPDVFHDLQPEFLSATLQLQDYNRNNFFTGKDLNVYYDSSHPLWHKRPDWFLAVGVPYLYENHDMRLSYVTWQEAANPFIIIELISPGTEDEDLGKVKTVPGKPLPKWVVYEQVLKVPYYFVFNRYTDDFKAFKLENGRYEALSMPDDQRIWIPELKIGLAPWRGTYKQINRYWLRWYDANHQWLPTEAEVERQRANSESQRANSERQRANSERQKAEKLAQKLRELGIDPENL